METKKLNNKQYKALKIIADFPKISAKFFADKMWGDTETNMFTKSSNQGHGATRGKAAWLCAGSYTGVLAKMGLVRKYPINGNWVALTDEGKESLKQFEADATV